MSRRKKAQQSEGGGEEWLQTYADTITLLLTFFVLLYASSSLDTVKFNKISSSLQSVLSGSNSNSILDFNPNGEVPIVGPPQEMGPKSGGGNEAMYSKVKEFMDKNKLNNTVQVKRDAKGIIIELKDNILFDSAQAEIKTPSKEILDKISNLLESVPNGIIIEGHTDNVPIHNAKYASNWELSTQRAVNVLKYFVENKGLAPDKFQAAGYGEFHPIEKNDNYANKAKNRRVNILITSGEKEKK
ncbi:chemotaxis protein MotB [Clostridium botulinum]|uniref:Chemotaxis protein MotB n=1 Tax=Clostridium botulinum D str. 1873 TaxID=592027 RepID=A0A9P2LKK7_CLOBO|nr:MULTISPECIES: OmpA family protein [Clostridium]NFV46846.1 chemotaxis protein MotB [Clostridium botulinum]AYF55001.1 chemotaxis protein MotB [Clostridium novyi]EES90578.1 chemotaxis protein MotB [Clostridium botulinum D str. 1873]MBO3442730.1 OmpA family protein [Clostridium haemolyticum]MCD3215968.1 OmpA family protein [Clostridium botulinum C]